MFTSSAYAVDLGSNLGLYVRRITHLIALPLLSRIEATCLIFASRPGKAKLCKFDQNDVQFAFMTLFDHANVNPRSRNLHQKCSLCKPAQFPSFVCLAFLKAEMAREEECTLSRAFPRRVCARRRKCPAEGLNITPSNSAPGPRSDTQ